MLSTLLPSRRYVFYLLCSKNALQLLVELQSHSSHVRSSKSAFGAGLCCQGPPLASKGSCIEQAVSTHADGTPHTATVAGTPTTTYAAGNLATAYSGGTHDTTNMALLLLLLCSDSCYYLSCWHSCYNKSMLAFLLLLMLLALLILLILLVILLQLMLLALLLLLTLLALLY